LTSRNASPAARGLVAAILAAGTCGCASSEGYGVYKPLSYVEIKYGVTVRQAFDYSCGAATLATMLTYYWDRPTSELDVMQVLRSRYPGQDWKTLQDRGFSFDDLIWAAAKFGFDAQGAEASAEQLGKLEGPAIVQLDKGKFKHFSIVRAAKVGHVFLSDPVAGAITMSDGEFQRQYTGKALAVWKRGAPLPKTAVLGRPIAPMDASLFIGGVSNVNTAPLNEMVGR
jgi:predicted double-glycine peptidase